MHHNSFLVGRKTVSVELPKISNFDAYYNSLSKHVRQNYRTAKNRMKRDNKSYRFSYQQGIIEDELLIRELMKLHKKRFVEKNKGLYIKNFINSIREYSSLAYASARLNPNTVLLKVYLDDDLAGYLLGLLDNKAIRIMQNCVNEVYSFYSPTFCATIDSLKEISDNGCQRIVYFTRGNES